jgi:hypothetical protein
MRMWMVDPKILCNQHLLGEHGEIHKHRHVFVKGWKITKRVISNNVQIEPKSMASRHDELVQEMLLRWPKENGHASPYEQPDLSLYTEYEKSVVVDVDMALKDLLNRCDKCYNRYLKYNRKDV